MKCTLHADRPFSATAGSWKLGLGDKQGTWVLHKQRTTAAKSRRVSFLLETPAWLVSRWQFHSPAGCCWPAHFGCCCCGSGWSNGHWGGWHRPRGHRGGLGWGGVATWACRSGLVVLWTSNASISVTRKRSKCRKAGFLSWLVEIVLEGTSGLAKVRGGLNCCFAL